MSDASKKPELDNDELQSIVVADSYSKTWNHPYHTIGGDAVYSSLPLSPNAPAVFYPRMPNGRKFSLDIYSKSRNYRPGTVRKLKRRAVLKNGDCNVVQSKVSHMKIFTDIFTTLVDGQWRWTLLIFFMSFMVSWLFFAVIWWLISYSHGDFDTENLASPGWTPCVTNINSFVSSFLFSLESQHTIGYGVRAITDECPEAVFVLCLQSSYGILMQAFMVGIVFAKMTRPKHRTQRLLFSKNALISQRDGELCLMFRVGDVRKSHIIGANIRAQLIRTKVTAEGEKMSQYRTELEVGTDDCPADLFFIWPLIVVHRINAASPLYEMSASDILQERFEIVVILEGTVESTGQTTQTRTSYLNTEILWGKRFEPAVYYNKEQQGYEINYAKFDAVKTIDTPLCSARKLYEVLQRQRDREQKTAEYNSRLPQKSLEHRIRIEEDAFRTSEQFSNNNWPRTSYSDEQIVMSEEKKVRTVVPAWTNVFKKSAE